MYEIKKSFFLRLWDRLSSLVVALKSSFANTRKPQSHIEEMDQLLKVSIADIEKIQKEMEQELDLDLMKQVLLIIDPIVFELRQLENMSPVISAHNLLPDELWYKKAKVWVDLSKKVVQREAILSALIEYTFGFVIEKIKDDVKSLLEHIDNEINMVDLSSQEKIEAERILKDQAKPFMEKLKNLHQDYDPISLKELVRWKKAFDEKRDRYHKAAVQSISRGITRYR